MNARRFAWAFSAALVLASPCLLPEGLARADSTLVFDGMLDKGTVDFAWVPFTVPAGTVEIEVRHQSLSPNNILDFGLYDAAGFRGWGGGNTEPAVVNASAASRSYLPGPISAGPWRVVIGKAKLVDLPAAYHVEVVLRSATTLAPQTVRRPYRAAAPLATGPRWWSGDLHVHSLESGDAKPPIEQIAAFARGRGLDFVALSDHNTISQVDFIDDVQARHPDLLLIPSVEFTTYAGHAGGLGATRFVDHKIGFEGATIEAAATAFAAQGAFFSINHPVLDLGTACIGCAWKHAVPTEIGGVEIATGGYAMSGRLFDERAIAFWDQLSNGGRHLTAVGGSDDHSGGAATGKADSPIGDPTTMVYADALSADAIIAAIRHGRTVVKLQGPDDPMVDLVAGSARLGDTLTEPRPTLTATVTGGKGMLLRFVKNGAPGDYIPVDADPFVYPLAVVAPGIGEDRYRCEVWDAAIRTVTSHLYVGAAPLDPVGSTKAGCGLDSRRAGRGWSAALIACLTLGLGALVRRRARPEGGGPK